MAFSICSFSWISQAQPLRFYHYTINDCLSQSSVKSVLPDNTGFIWMATQDGLNRFDGKNFKVWKRKSGKPPLSDNNISQIILVNGKIWIGTYGGGINVYDADTDSILWIKRDGDLIHSLPDNNVNALLLTFPSVKLC